jgi:NAD(P)H dehydrogenase (quinone)
MDHGPVQIRTGNLCGSSHAAAGGTTNEVTSAVACYQGRRVVDLAAALEAGRAA